MNSRTSLTADGIWLRDQLAIAKANARNKHTQDMATSKIYVASSGYMVSSAYEQLRNAAEYTEEHLLLQRAIRRFYKRNISFHEATPRKNLGEELVIELTQAGYLANNTVNKTTATHIDKLILEHYRTYYEFKKHHVGQERSIEWLLDTISVQTEVALNKNPYIEIFANFSYQHYVKVLYKEKLFETDKVTDYEASLYVAIHRALLKSDIATTRNAMIQLYRQSPKNISEYIHFNKKIDEIFASHTTETLTRVVNKHGAPLRIIKRMIDEYPNLNHVLDKQGSFLGLYEDQTHTEYKAIGKKVNRGIIKSIIFLFITKVIVGIAIEIPYDLYITGTIIVLPLVINLLVPPLYMATLKLGLTIPGHANTLALKEYADALLYESNQDFKYAYTRAKSSNSLLASIAYAMMFIVSFGFVTSLLLLAHFEWLHIIIFFIFISTASFLGFRLSRMIQELEIITTKQGIIAVLRDFFYTPFILVGSWLSDKYARMNFATLILDMAIELPLKTFLRLSRQWTRFLSEKRDQI